MHRQFSLQPFSRHYSHSTNPFLEFLEIEQTSSEDTNPRISVTPEKRQDLLEVLTAYKSVQASRTLHTLTFVTVNDYLWLLRAVSQELSLLLKRKAMFYLAAAVSDFFLPRQKMVKTCFSFYLFTYLYDGICSQNTRYNQAKEVCQSKWTKYQRF
jgi:phosphopantothenate---cysteine ligase (ATP)